MEKRMQVLVPVFLLWLLQGCVHVKGDEALIKDTCNKTEIPSFCISLFLANSSSLGADLFGLATISTGVLVSNVTAAQPVVAELARKATEPLLKTAFTDCNSSYLEGINWGVNALSYLGAKDFSRAATYVTGAYDSVSICRDVFDQFNLTYPPVMSRFQQTVYNLTDVVHIIINILKG